MRAITCNLGCGGPGGSKFVTAAHSWAKAVRDAAFDIVFAQEIPDDTWLGECEEAYDVFLGTEPTYRARSVVLVRRGLGGATRELPTARYHGSYLAAATLPTTRHGQVVLVSVHASPTRLSGKDLGVWKDCGYALPNPRYAPELWDADLALDTVQLVSAANSVITAGDWNEARRWDERHPGAWGKRFFANAESFGLCDATWEHWKAERPTCRASKHAEYQTDHVLVSQKLTSAVKSPRVLTQGDLAGRSDHWPIAFDLDL